MYYGWEPLRDIATPGNDVSCIASDVPLFTQECQGLVSGIQGHMYHLGALGNEHAFLGLYAITQLSLGQGAEHFDTGMMQVGDVDKWHTESLSDYGEKRVKLECYFLKSSST